MTPRRVIIGPAKYPHCFGTTMQGVHLVYVPHGAFVGTDVVDYTVVFGRGRVPYRTEITIQQETPDRSKRRRAEKFEPDGSEGKGSAIPECAPLVSSPRDAPAVLPRTA